MRTTISLEDRLAIQVRREAALRGLSVSRFIADTLNDALKQRDHEPDQPFRLVTVGGAGLLPEVDLGRPRALEVAEDESNLGGFQPSGFRGSAQ